MICRVVLTLGQFFLCQCHVLFEWCCI
jgi:hypothetical protein